MIDKMRAFLLSYPGWEEGKLLYIDDTDNAPGNGGLFPQGVQTVAIRQDILGNCQQDYRATFTLYRASAETEADAPWLLEFQSWIDKQSALALTPKFGDVPQKERLRAEKGKLHSRQGTGGLYSVILTAEFTKLHEVNEIGEN